MERRHWALLQKAGGALAAVCLVGLLASGLGGGLSARRQARLAEALAEGQAAFKEQRYSDAAAAFERAAAADARSPVAWASLGNARLALSRHAGAIEAYGRALAAAPDDPGALVGRAMTRWLIGELDGAEEDYRRLIALQPDRMLHMVQLEKVHRERGKLADIVGMWEQAERLHPGDKDWDMTGRLVHILYEMRDWEGLASRCERALDTGPTEEWRPRYLFYRGVASSRLGRFERALEDLERVLEMRPRWPLADYAVIFEELTASAAGVGDLAKSQHYRALFAQNCKEGDCRP